MVAMTPHRSDESPRDGTVEAFAAQVAHDFNNLLTGVLGNLELLRLRAVRSGAVGLDCYVEGANAAAQRLVAFAHRLSLFSGRTAHAPQPVALQPLLRELVTLSQGRNVALDLPEEAPVVLADAAGLRQALLELLQNAWDADAEVTLRAIALEDGAVIVVRDNGPGMAPEILAQARGLFFTTRANGAGRGLGLPIVVSLATRAGGRLELDSAPGEGCEVRLYLPLA